ncbi:hypothetical protein NL676_016618 [Syzygium grande]|nr:hypothetical protein NL676_016618 [Syzygium grande]
MEHAKIILKFLVEWIMEVVTSLDDSLSPKCRRPWIDEDLAAECIGFSGIPGAKCSQQEQNREGNTRKNNPKLQLLKHCACVVESQLESIRVITDDENDAQRANARRLSMSPVPPPSRVSLSMLFCLLPKSNRTHDECTTNSSSCGPASTLPTSAIS